MRTYFRNGDLVITDREVVILLEPPARFAIEELHQAGFATASAGTPAAEPATERRWNRSRWRPFARTWELRALYRGSTVCLYATNDKQTFGQVRRAMIRALEANGKL